MSGREELLDLAGRWAGLFKLLGDPTRLRLLAVMHHRAPGTATVTDLAEATGVRVATASAALRAMEAAGVVSGERVGREVRYTLDNSRIHDVLHHVGFSHDSYSHEKLD